MSFFEEQLKKGRFYISKCKNCNIIFWPIQKVCNKCGENSSWVESSYKGTIIEFSKKESEFFGLVKIDEDIRLLGKIISSELPSIGQSVMMEVGFQNRPVYSFIVKKN